MSRRPLRCSVSSAEDPLETSATSATSMDCQDADPETDKRFDKLIRDWLATVPHRDWMTTSRCGEFIVSCNLG